MIINRSSRKIFCYRNSFAETRTISSNIAVSDLKFNAHLYLKILVACKFLFGGNSHKTNKVCFQINTLLLDIELVTEFLFRNTIYYNIRLLHAKITYAFLKIYNIVLPAALHRVQDTREATLRGIIILVSQFSIHQL